MPFAIGRTVEDLTASARPRSRREEGAGRAGLCWIRRRFHIIQRGAQSRRAAIQFRRIGADIFRGSSPAKSNERRAENGRRAEKLQEIAAQNRPLHVSFLPTSLI